MDKPEDRLPLEPLDRIFHNETRHLMFDEHGREILIGLNVEESHWLIRHRDRRWQQASLTNNEKEQGYDLELRHLRVRAVALAGKNSL